MYNQGNINITYDNGNISVEFKNLTDKYTGEVKPSCEGHITLADNEKKTFEFSEENKEIVWTGLDARDKWIRG